MIAPNDPIKKYEPLWGNWEVVDLLGTGSYGRVYRVVRQDGGTYESAVKLISIPASQADVNEAKQMGMDQASIYSYFHSTAERIIKEINMMHTLKGEANIVSYEDHQIFHEEGTLQWDILIRMELLNSLESYLINQVMIPDDVRRLGIEICSALETCASYGIIHRDIKEGNIFINTRGVFKLGDFGIAREMAGMGSMSMRGTPAYIAPEVYNGNKYDGRADIYSLGVLMYKLLNDGRYPFLPPAPAPITLEDTEKAFARRISGELPVQPAYGDSALRAAVMRAISFDPFSRFQSAVEFKYALMSVASEPAQKAVYKKSNINHQPVVPLPVPNKMADTMTMPVLPQSAYLPANGSPYTGQQPNPERKLSKGKIAAIVSASALVVTAVVLAVVLTLPQNAMTPHETETPAAMPSLAVAAPAPADPDALVEWTDSTLAELIGSALGKSADNIYYRDLAAITELYLANDAATLSAEEFEEWSSLYSGRDTTISIKDLRHCTGLKTLKIRNEYLTSLKPLADLTQLNEFCLEYCGRPDSSGFDISPLGEMPWLTQLNLYRTDVGDMSALASLVNLTVLNIGGENLSGLEAISQMTSLESLTINESPVSSIPDIERLRNLKYLYMPGCSVSGVYWLESSPGLEELNLEENNVGSLNGLQSLPNLNALNLANNKIADISVLAEMDSVIYLGLEYNYITNITPLLDMDALLHLTIVKTDGIADTLKLLKDKGVYIFYAVSGSSPYTPEYAAPVEAPPAPAPAESTPQNNAEEYYPEQVGEGVVTSYAGTYVCSDGFSGDYRPTLILKDDNTYTLTVNLGVSMGKMMGTYEFDDFGVLLYIESCDFSGFAGDSYKMVEFTKRGNDLILSFSEGGSSDVQLGLISSGAIFYYK